MIGRLRYRRPGETDVTTIELTDAFEWRCSDKYLALLLQVRVPTLVGPQYGYPGVRMLERAEDLLRRYGPCKMELSAETKKGIIEADGGNVVY